MAQAVIFLLTFGIIARGALGLVGGHDAPNHGYPYQVSFRHYDGKHFCSGSILNKRWILTAGHCFDGELLNELETTAGDTAIIIGGDFNVRVGEDKSLEVDMFEGTDLFCDVVSIDKVVNARGTKILEFMGENAFVVINGRCTAMDLVKDVHIDIAVSLSDHFPVLVEIWSQARSERDEAEVSTEPIHTYTLSRNLKSFAIVTGTNFLNETGTINWPDFYVVHEEYRTYYKNNIALVRVIQDFVFTDSVKPITLPNENLQNYSMPAVTTGWGMTRMGSPLPNALQELDVNVLTVKQCEHPHNQVDDREICTLNKFGEGVCYGDDGGPLVINGLQVGIISYFGACAINSPDVYTRVWAYNTWINKTLARCPST